MAACTASRGPATPIAPGIHTDGWQPIERDYRITRELLEVLCETRHPVHIVTKSGLVTRDLDLLTDMARDNLMHVFVSVTTLDNRLSAKLEPRANMVPVPQATCCCACPTNSSKFGASGWICTTPGVPRT